MHSDSALIYICQIKKERSQTVSEIWKQTGDGGDAIDLMDRQPKARKRILFGQLSTVMLYHHQFTYRTNSLHIK